MKKALCSNRTLFASATAVIMTGFISATANATAPCGDFGECKVLVEINATDGDIGFHFLKDGDDLLESYVEDPNGQRVFQDKAKGTLMDQKYTETFVESAEPLCWMDPDADPDELIVTLEDFVDRWAAGTYGFFGKAEGGEMLEGESDLTFDLPAAPVNLSYKDGPNSISWDAGSDLGQCATEAELEFLVLDGVLPTHPRDVPIVQWEVVVEIEGDLPWTFSVHLSPDQTSVHVPSDFLNQFDDDTPAKIEVGAKGVDDNATVTETEICINEKQGCEEEED